MYTIFEKRERKMFVICPKCAAKYQIPAEIALKNGQKVQCSACQHVFHFEKEEVLVQNESFSNLLQEPEDAILKETELIERKEKIVIETQLPEVFHPLKPIETQKTHSWLLTLLLAVLLVVLVVGFWLYRDMAFSDINQYKIKTSRILMKKDEVKSSDFDVQKEQKNAETEQANRGIVEIPLFDEDTSLNERIDLKQVPAYEKVLPFSFSSVHFRYQTTPQEKQVLIEGKIHNDTDVAQIMPDVVYAKAYDQKGNILFQKEIYFSKELIEPYGEKSFYSTYIPAPDGIQWMEVTCEK